LQARMLLKATKAELRTGGAGSCGAASSLNQCLLSALTADLHQRDVPPLRLNRGPQLAPLDHVSTRHVWAHSHASLQPKKQQQTHHAG
jgi:hypothetical protein